MPLPGRCGPRALSHAWRRARVGRGRRKPERPQDRPSHCRGARDATRGQRSSSRCASHASQTVKRAFRRCHSDRHKRLARTPSFRRAPLSRAMSVSPYAQRTNHCGADSKAIAQTMAAKRSPDIPSDDGLRQHLKLWQLHEARSLPCFMRLQFDGLNSAEIGLSGFF